MMGKYELIVYYSFNWYKKSKIESWQDSNNRILFKKFISAFSFGGKLNIKYNYQLDDRKIWIFVWYFIPFFVWLL